MQIMSDDNMLTRESQITEIGRRIFSVEGYRMSDSCMDESSIGTQ